MVSNSTEVGSGGGVFILMPNAECNRAGPRAIGNEPDDLPASAATTWLIQACSLFAAPDLQGRGVTRGNDVPGLSVQEHLNEVVAIIAAKGNEDRLSEPGPRELRNPGRQWRATLKNFGVVSCFGYQFIVGHIA